MNRFSLCVLIAVSCAIATSPLSAAEPTVVFDAPMSPPGWALLERQLLDANAAACAEFYAKYFDERGYLLCVERWGGNDGPDDAIENCNDWPLLHVLGAPDVVRKLYERAWEGHLRQYTLAKTVEVPLARDGMYYKEFPTQFDWVHNGEGLNVFNLMGLTNPGDARFQQRTKRYAGFYMNEDPGAPNYDPQHKIIKSLFNGSRGPLLRKATALDWAGDPIEIENRFLPKHGERTYAEMLEHFKDYGDIIGDHPQNLKATSLAFNAFALTGDEKYKQWLLEYVDAWKDRAAKNNDILPSNVGLDGVIGGATEGKWYGGVYGWGFTVVVPQNGTLSDRNQVKTGFHGFKNAFVLTGDQKYLDVWRKQFAAVNAAAKVIDGKKQYPRMYGDQGWYGWVDVPFNEYALETYFLSLRDDDLALVPKNPWLDFLQGKHAAFPESALRHDLDEVRRCVAEFRVDATTPDTRLADDMSKMNPATTEALVQLTMGGLPTGIGGNILLARLRYFDPVRARAGLPEDVAALVTRMTADETDVTLVNVNQLAERTVVVQAGTYGEHQITAVTANGGVSKPHDATTLQVRLAPGSGGKLTLRMRRFANRPTFTFPF